MSFAPPSDYDEEYHSTTDDDTPAEEKSQTEEDQSPDEADNRHNEDIEEASDALEEVIETHAEAIRTKADDKEISTLYDELDAVCDQLDDIQGSIEHYSDYHLEVEAFRRERTKQIEQFEGELACLLTAVFDENHPCPECDNGTLEKVDPWVGNSLTCSNEECNFERELGQG